jgi:hypothetical protein
MVAVGGGMAVTVGDGITIGVHVGGGGGEVRVGFMVGEAASVAAAFIVGDELLARVRVGAVGEVAARLGTAVLAEIDS